MIRKPIATTLAKYGLIIAVVLGLLAGVLQILEDFRREKLRNDALVQNILTLSSAGVTQAAFQLDSGLAIDALKPLLIYDFITSARLVDDRGQRMGTVSQTPTASRFDPLADLMVPKVVTYDISLVEPTSGLNVGRLTIDVNSSALFHDFFLRSLRLAVFGVLRNLMLTLVLLYLFHALLTRPLAALAENLGNVDPRDPKPFALPANIVRGENEITFLARSTNDILDSSRLHLAELAEAERQTATMTDQLRHNERLSAIGQLVGGVAHDFNNILAIILGTLELLEDEPLTPRAQKLSATARQASEKGAKLTGHLLAYSRNQPLAPAPFLSSDLFRDLEALLKRALGESYEIEFVSASGLWHCFADRQQVETVILNLALNARDAMPDGGNLTIDARNVYLDLEYTAHEEDVKPGQYVCIAITDNGTGMTREVISHAFEPYFTTKPPGGGSGLGLAMAYGFAKQSHGHIKIYSEEGQGTTVKLYLPRHHAKPLLTTAPHVEDAGQVDLGARQILVVEDDPMVLEVVQAHLHKMNARVVAAQTAEETLALLGAGATFDAALIDVILPGGISGRELSHMLDQKYPGLPIAFMSGYTENAIIHNARLDEGVILLQKPFTRQALAIVIDRLLNQPK